MASRNVRAGKTSISLIKVAAVRFPAGKSARSLPCRCAARSAGTIPRDGRNRPSSESSPRMTIPSTNSLLNFPSAIKIAIAIGRSKLEPVLGSHAGERETVIRDWGQRYPEFANALRTRSRDSCSAESGNPRSVNAGIPGAMSTSTVTISPSIPWRATD